MSEDKKQKYLKIFRAEAEEHIKNLNDGLLQLEKKPDREDLVQALLRSAHTLKGSARMLGLEEIGTIAHKMEDIFKDVEKGEIKAEAKIMDLLFEGADGINKLVEELTAGKKPSVNAEEYKAKTIRVLEALPQKKEEKSEEKEKAKKRPSRV